MAAWVSTQTGDWSRASNNADSPWYDAGTQSARSSYPGAAADSDTVTIAAHTVTLDASPPEVMSQITNSATTGYVAVGADRTLKLNGTYGIYGVVANTDGLIRVSAGVLTITHDQGAGTNAVRQHTSGGRCIVTTGTGGLSISNTGGVAVFCNTPLDGVVTVSGTGAVAITGSLDGIGRGAVVVSAGSTVVINGDVTNNSSGRNMLTVNHASADVTLNGTLTGTGAGTNISISNGTLKWTGARQIDASSLGVISVAAAGTLTLATDTARLVLDNRRTLIIFAVTGATMNIADIGADVAQIINYDSTAQAVISGPGWTSYKTLVVGPIIPAEADVADTAADYGYAGDLQTGTLAAGGGGGRRSRARYHGV